MSQLTKLIRVQLNFLFIPSWWDEVEKDEKRVRGTSSFTERPTFRNKTVQLISALWFPKNISKTVSWTESGTYRELLRVRLQVNDTVLKLNLGNLCPFCKLKQRVRTEKILGEILCVWGCVCVHVCNKEWNIYFQNAK